MGFVPGMRAGTLLALAFSVAAEATGQVSFVPEGDNVLVIGADAGGGPHVRVFDTSTGALRSSFFAYSPGFLGGVRVAMGDVNGDGFIDIITGAGPGAPGGHVKVFDGTTGALLLHHVDEASGLAEHPFIGDYLCCA